MNFCQVKLDKINLEQAKEKIGYFLTNSGQFKVFTPNPEFIVQVQKDRVFRDILDMGDLNICDGFGLSLFSGCPRITGVDFMLEICKIAAEKNVGIYLLGSSNNEVIKQTAEKLQKQILNLKISGYNKGIVIARSETTKQTHEVQKTMGLPRPFGSRNDIKTLFYDKLENEEIIKNINESNANILFVAFGMNKQECWISENLAKMPNIRIAMGVGGSFDYLSGIVRRAPCFLRKIGLEWLYRLIKQPQRLGRIFNATVVFTYIVLKNKIFKKYDKN